jgi:hypothetical protein
VLFAEAERSDLLLKVVACDTAKEEMPSVSDHCPKTALPPNPGTGPEERSLINTTTIRPGQRTVS